jgi:hypothetical protein
MHLAGPLVLKQRTNSPCDTHPCRATLYIVAEQELFRIFTGMPKSFLPMLFNQHLRQTPTLLLADHGFSVQ